MPPEPAQTSPAEPAGAPASGAPAPRTPPAAPAGPAATAATPGPLSSPRRPSMWERLQASDERWAWKAAIRLLQCVVAIVGIACAAYVLATMADFDGMTLFGRNVANELFIAFFAVSFAWGAADILARFLRHYSKPLNPLLVLCVDFTFCCVLLYLIAAAVASILSVQRFGDDPGWLRIWHDGTARGPYRQDSNGVWVYAGGSRRCTPGSAECAAQDAAVNAAWSQKPARFALAIVIAAMLVLSGICHFALCVWAGVDAYTRRKRKARELMYQPVYVPVPVPAPVPMQPMGPYDKQVPGHQVPMPGYVYGHEQTGPAMGSGQTRYA